MIGLSQPELAAEAGVSVPTLKRAEGSSAVRASDAAIEKVAEALRRRGVEFIAENGGGAGVRLRGAKR